MGIIEVYLNRENKLVGYYYNNNENPTQKLTTIQVENILRILYGLPANIDLSKPEVLQIEYEAIDIDEEKIKRLSEILHLNQEDKIKIHLNERTKIKNQEIISDYMKQIRLKTAVGRRKSQIEGENKIVPKKSEPQKDRVITFTIHETIPVKISNPEKKEKKKPKVQRTNKFIKRTIAITLAFFALVAIKQWKKKIEIEKDNTPTKPSTTYVDPYNEPTTTIVLEPTTKLSNNNESSTEIITEPTTIEPTTKTQKETEPQIKPIKITSEYNYEINLDTEDKRGDEKYNNVINNYLPIIEKYSEMYGIDPKLIVAIASQERGFHSSEIDSGGGIGIMQVQYNVWAGNSVTAYNFKTNQYETEIIDGDKLGDIDYNFKIGIKILSHYSEKADQNLPCLIMGNNKGIYGVLAKVGEKLRNPEDLSWLDDAREIPNGDDDYLEHIFSYIGPGEIITIKTKDGKEIKYLINNNVRNKQKKF